MGRYYLSLNEEELDYKRILRLNKPITFIKLETTGLNVESDEVCKVTAIRYNVNDYKLALVGRFCAIVKTFVPITDSATKISGITQADIMRGYDAGYVANELTKFLNNSYICAFNKDGFVLPFLQKFLKNATNRANFHAFNGFEAKNVVKAVTLPEEHNNKLTRGYDLVTLTSLYKVPNNGYGAATVLEECIKKLPKGKMEYKPDFLINYQNFVENGLIRGIIFTTQFGRIFYNSNTGYFECVNNEFDAFDMESFCKFLEMSTGSNNVGSAMYRLSRW